MSYQRGSRSCEKRWGGVAVHLANQLLIERSIYDIETHQFASSFSEYRFPPVAPSPSHWWWKISILVSTFSYCAVHQSSLENLTFATSKGFKTLIMLLRPVLVFFCAVSVA